MREENNIHLFFSDKFNRRCGVTKTILPPTIKQEPLEVTSQPVKAANLIALKALKFCFALI